MTNEREALTDEQIVSVWQGMPGGPEGWLRQFGFLQFARAIEAEVRAALSQPSPAVRDVNHKINSRHAARLLEELVEKVRRQGYKDGYDAGQRAAPQPTKPAQPATQAGAGEKPATHPLLRAYTNAVFDMENVGDNTSHREAGLQLQKARDALNAALWAAPTTEQPGDAASITPPDWGPIHTLVSGKVELWPASFRDYLDSAFRRGVRAARAAHGKGGQG
jgi:hypothetical protein